MSLFRTLLASLSDHGAAIDRWLVDCRMHSSPSLRRVSISVAFNLESEAQFEAAPFLRFLGTLHHELETRTSAAQVVEPFSRACRAHALQGPEANVGSDQVFGKVTGEEDLMTFVARSAGWPESDKELLYRTLVSAGRWGRRFHAPLRRHHDRRLVSEAPEPGWHSRSQPGSRAKH